MILMKNPLKIKKSNSKYSMLNNYIFTFKKAATIDKWLLVATFAQIPIKVILPILTAYLASSVVRMVTKGASDVNIVISIAYFTLFISMLYLIKNTCEKRISTGSYFYRLEWTRILNDKYMDTDYQNIENPTGQNLYQKAKDGLEGNNGIQSVFEKITTMISSFAGLLTYSVILMYLSPWLVAILIVFTIVNSIIYHSFVNWRKATQNLRSELTRKQRYICNKATDFSNAKDIRLYRIADWFLKLYEDLIYQLKLLNQKDQNQILLNSAAQDVTDALRNGGAYALLIYKIVSRGISVADFVFYFTLVGNYSEWLYGLIRTYLELLDNSNYISYIREFLDMPDSFNRGKGIALPKSITSITFDNVRFCYPGSDTDTIRSVSFTIKEGEKLALVGLNGAGKTTIVKLLCGLYRPNSGTIKINGHNIDEFNRDEYYSLFSVVFQDILTLPLSINKNIISGFDNGIDSQKVIHAIKQSGLDEKVDALLLKENTPLVKSVHNNAIELSGGEAQKLALARALYKEGKIMVLDEPTAAFDPIAENKMYLAYNDLTKDCCALYISHRLASTRFCDRVILLCDGKITEEGTHDDLIQKGGEYAKMFELQSYYYKDGAVNE